MRSPEAADDYSTGAAPILAPACAAVTVALYVVFTGLEGGRRLEARASHFGLEGRWDPAGNLLEALIPAVVLALALGGLSLAARRRLGRAVAAAAATLVLAPSLAVVAEAALGAWDPMGGERGRELGAAYYPSGHATLVMAAALSLLLLAPARRRVAVALASGAVTAVHGLATFADRSHHPSDVLGGFFLAGALAGALARFPEAGETRRVRLHVLLVAIGAAALAAAGLVLEARGHSARIGPFFPTQLVAAGSICAGAFLVPLMVTRAIPNIR